MTGLDDLTKGSIQIVTEARRSRMDCETPVSLYLKLASEKDYGFILESVDHGEHSGRFSFIGWDPIFHLSYHPGKLVLEGSVQREIPTENPLETLKTLLGCFHMRDALDIPHSRGGFIGHIGYDAIRLVEDIGPLKDTKTPWIDLIMPRCLIVMDHSDHTVTIFSHQAVIDGDEAGARNRAQAYVQKVDNKIKNFSIANAVAPALDMVADTAAWQSNLSKDEYCDMVRRAKQHIVDGDIFQVVLSRAIRREFHGEPFEVYRVLRMINPSPYMFYLKQGERAVVGGSPEALVTLDQGQLTTKPIAGTRPRGADFNEDMELERDLLSDQKEIAEHVMLVDLGRNDLGRVAQAGTVTVPSFKQIERYSHVMHIVSVVQAHLHEDRHAIDALMSVFPAGTLSGAPKIRAMQIINDFEPESREIYGGAIGFIDLSGDMDSCIAIRTAVIEDGVVRVQAGAGIVADSDPDREYDETTHKMMSMVAAVEQALQLERR